MSAFPLRTAWRETRGAWRHFLGLFACVALGVGALVGVQSVAESLHGTLTREGRTLMGGDLELRSLRPLEAEAEHRIEDLHTRGAAVARIRELAVMTREPVRGRTMLVEVKAVDEAYPLYGRVDTGSGRALAALLGTHGIVVQDAVLARLGTRVGDPLTIGNATFTITDVLRREPDRSVGLSLGPRVFLSAAGLDRTGLVQVGSRVRYRTLVRLPPALDAVGTRATLARELSDPALRVASYGEAQPGLRRSLAQATTYLGLVGLTSLLVGGIGVAASVRTFLVRQRPTIAILKCLGADSRALLQAYLLQTLAIGSAGTLAGTALGGGVLALLAPLLAGLVPFEVQTRLTPVAILHGVVMGLLTTFLCGLWPLTRLREKAPLAILREPAPPEGRRPAGGRLAALPVALGLVSLTLWQAGSVKIGGIFLLASVGALALLVTVAVALRRGSRRLRRLRSLAWRHGLANLHRPGSQAVGVVASLGVGVMLLVAVALLERGLARQLDLESRRESPSFFFVDIQRDQTDAFVRAVAGTDGGTPPTLVPVVRSRLVAINGRPIVRREWEGREDAWRVTREYVLTIAAEPPAGTAVTRGRWWTPAEAASRPRISVEDEAARALGVDLGGRLTFDIQGVRVEAEVESLRKVDWQTLSANFFVIFSPGALDGAPLTYLATARVPAAAEVAVQERVAAALPNVTAIPVRDVLDRVSGILERIGAAIRVLGLFVLGAGLIVMAGALAQSRYQRLYESVLLRTLGASRGAVARAFAVEYGCLGLTAGIAGTALGSALAWVVLRLVLDLPWALEPGTLALGVGLTAALALGVGFLGTFRLLGQKPLVVLHRE